MEGLPWLVVDNRDLEWLTFEAKAREVQNRLGFIITLGRRVAEKRSADEAGCKLRKREKALEELRLARG